MKSCPKELEGFFIKLLFKQLFKYKISLLIILVLTYISTTFELLPPLLLANIINIGLIDNYGFNYIKNIVIVMAFLVLLSTIINYFISYLINRLSIYSSNNIKDELFAKILSLKTKEKEKFTTTSLYTRTTSDIEQIKSFISSFLSIVIKAPILIFSSITILKTINKNFSHLLIISITFLILYIIMIVKKLAPLSKEIQLKIENINKLIKEKINGIKIIKSFNKLKEQEKKFDDTNEKYFTTIHKVIKLSSKVLPVLNLLINTSIIIILVISINYVKNQNLDVGSIVATIQYILQILLSILMLSMIFISLPKAKVCLTRVREIMNLESNDLQEKSKFTIEKLSYKNVSFSYNNEKNTLKNITFALNKNESIGIIGPTGSGKTTLMKLLLKEYFQKEGEILINNQNIESFSYKEIINSITYIPQNPEILTGTILENIIFSNTTLSKEELSKLIATCNLASFINTKDEKLNYRLEENGSNLSRGQKQRIAIARALARKNDFIIFDDSFSALDYKTESQIKENLRNNYPNLTNIIISQKISSIMNCDKIVFMDNGKITAIDTHNKLLINCPKYKEIYDLQKELVDYD